MDVTLDVTEELKCPVCFEYFKPPIALCENGHSTCAKCKSKMAKCPLCRAKFLNASNRTLNKVMRGLRFHCEFRNLGCTVKSSMDEIRGHEMRCPRRPYRCPIENCTWSRPLSGIKIHLRSKHSMRMYEQGGEYIIALGSFGKKSEWHAGLSFCGEIFLQVSKIKGDKFYACVLHIGPENISSNFKYNVEIRGADGKGSVSAEYVVRNYVCSLGRVARLGSCARFAKNIAQKCMKTGSTLNVKVRMYAMQV